MTQVISLYGDENLKPKEVASEGIGYKKCLASAKSVGLISTAVKQTLILKVGLYTIRNSQISLI